MIVALDRFGAFTGLNTARSSATDVFPNTPTFSFHGASYQSDYLDFESVETQDSSGKPLETPTAAQNQIFQQFNAPPYVPASSQGAIPFIDFGNKYLISGSSYSPDVLKGQSWDAVATSLSNPNTDATKGIVGTANVMTAAICSITNNQPADVCGETAIAALEAKLPHPAGS